jgi:hypothetical protein
MKIGLLVQTFVNMNRRWPWRRAEAGLCPVIWVLSRCYFFRCNVSIHFVVVIVIVVVVVVFVIVANVMYAACV